MKLIENIRKKVVILIAFAFLSIFAFVLYHPGANGPYMLDDFFNLRNNTSIKLDNLSLSSLRDAAFSMKTGPLYRPVTMLSFALNYYFTGNIDGYPIKLINIFIHILTAWGVFLLTLLLLRRLEKGDDITGYDESNSRWAGYTALFIAAIWLLHPFHVSTVLYTVQRMTELAAMFSFYAAVAYVKGRNDLLKGNKSGLWWVLGAVIAGGTFAVLSKESGALLPSLLLVIEGVFYRFRFHPDINNKSIRYPVYGVLIIPTIGIFAYLSGVVITMPAGLYFRDFTLFQRLLTESRALFFYIGLIFFPDISYMGLNHDDFVVSHGILSPPTTLLSAAGVVILSVIGLYGVWKKRYPVVSFAILWFLVGHLLESTVVQLELVFEHRNYLPAYGLMFAAGYYISHYLRISKRVTPGFRYAVPLLILMLLAIPLRMRIGNWSLPSKFYLSELRNHPKSARNLAGLAYQQALVRQYPKAVASYQMASKIDPDETGLLLAGYDVIVYKMNGVPHPDLVNMIEASLRNNKITPYTVMQLFDIASDSLNMDENSPTANRALAERFLVTAIRNRQPWPTDDHLGEAYFFLGEIKFRHNQLEEAAVALERTVALFPAKHDARFALARIYMNLNKVKEAEEQVKRLEDIHLEPSRKVILAEIRQSLATLKTGSGNL